MEKFTFAGFEWPRKIPRYLGYAGATVHTPRKKTSKRWCFTYYAAPTPGQTGMAFYLDSDFMPGLRWQWCDNVSSRIRHKGWFTMDDHCGDTIRGLVMRLPHGRGFLAGASMGEGMLSWLETDTIWAEELDAAYRADSYAERLAEKECEYHRKDQAEQEIVQNREDIADLRRERKTLLREMKQLKRARPGLDMGLPSVGATLNRRIRELRRESVQLHENIGRLQAEY